MPVTVDDDVLDAATAGDSALRGSALRSGAYAVSVLVSLISAPLLIRHLGVADFGFYVTINALVTIVAGVSDLGLTTLGVREWAQSDPAGRRALMRDLLGARIVLTAVGVAGAMGFALAAGYGTQRLLGTAFACTALIILSVQLALIVPLAGRLRQGWIGAAEVTRGIVQTATVLILIAADAGLALLLAAAIPAAIASLVLTLIPARDALTLPSLNPRRWSRLLRGTLAFAAASAVSVLYLRTTLVLTSLTATGHENGEFGIAFRVLEILINVPALVIGALFPLFARAALSDRERLRAGVGQTWRAACTLGAALAVVLATAAPVVILILAGSRPAGAVDALRILSFGLGCSFVGATAQYGLLAAHAHRPILLVNLGALTLNAVLTLLLAPAHGAVGAAIALSVCELFIAISASLALARTVGRLELEPALAGRVLAVAAVGVAAVLLVPGAVAGALVAPALAGLAALAVGAVPRQLVTALLRR